MTKAYIKDLSFEAPNAFENFSKGAEDPDLSVRLAISHSRVDDDQYEVVLDINIHLTTEERNLYLIELQQAGIFKISGVSDEERAQIIQEECAPSLFPFMREIVWSIIGKAGYPPMLLGPLNFDTMWESIQKDPDQGS
jgi:preprotein translocase subunit SecB